MNTGLVSSVTRNVLRLAESYKKAGAIFESARCYAQVGEKEQMFILLDDHFRRRFPHVVAKAKLILIEHL